MIDNAAAAAHHIRGLPDKMSASEGGGGHAKADAAREVVFNFSVVVQLWTWGSGENSKNFVDIINGCPLNAVGH